MLSQAKNVEAKTKIQEYKTLSTVIYLNVFTFTFNFFYIRKSDLS